jgi:hypothetical protein
VHPLRICRIGQRFDGDLADPADQLLTCPSASAARALISDCLQA